MTVVDIAKELIFFDTSGPPAREKPCAEWIRDYLVDLGVDAEIQVVAPDRANVIAKIGAGKGPGLVLSGHIDVVLAGELDDWKVSGPFDPVVRNGKLYGRGACDMKGSDAALIQAATELSKEDFKRQLTLVFTAGEDTGGWFVNRILEEGKVTPEEARFGVIPEPSMMEIVRCHKASGGATVLILGKAAHSSRPEMGVNAILNSACLLDEMVKLQERLDEVVHPLLGPSTIKPTMMKGGLKGNIIPPSAEVSMNARLIPRHEGNEAIAGWMEDVIARCVARDPEFKAEVVKARGGRALDVPEDSEGVVLLKEILGTEPVGVPYYTEAVSYTTAGIPTVICGPGSIDQAHTSDEYISLEQLDRGVGVFKELIRRVCL
ncbi:MAG: ArgE/DapE family deacylase [Candidatus Bathyarchaeota archaeon]|nr:MAG: ArgE/DapE family deacylase [Candidatus Bathyarchaeota archaeon]